MANRHLTATTAYPCFGQDLGDLAGAGSVCLPLQNYVVLKENKNEPSIFVHMMEERHAIIRMNLTLDRLKQEIISGFFLLVAIVLFIGGCGSAEKELREGRALMRQGKFREAIPFLTESINNDNANYQAFNTRGVAYFELKEYPNALLDYQQAIQLKPDFYRPYYNRALLRTAQGDTDAAIRDYSEAIRRIPDTGRSTSAEIFLNRGQLFATVGRLSAALADFDQAVRFDSTNASAFYNRANIRFQKGEYSIALTDFMKTVQLNSKFGKAFYGLGMTQIMINQRETGCLSLRQAYRLGYVDAEVSMKEYCQ